MSSFRWVPHSTAVARRRKRKTYESNQRKLVIDLERRIFALEHVLHSPKLCPHCNGEDTCKSSKR